MNTDYKRTLSFNDPIKEYVPESDEDLLKTIDNCHLVQ